jgi:5-enolpyruvylshikimate-3-phosphate synthase
MADRGEEVVEAARILGALIEAFEEEPEEREVIRRGDPAPACQQPLDQRRAGIAARPIASLRV